jgi:hypothetical protein
MADASPVSNADELDGSDTLEITFSLQLISHIPTVTKFGKPIII